jgi:ribosome biogenesis GTPase
MARRHKGKSQRRIKDWQVRYEAGEDIDHTTGQHRLAPKEVKLGQDRFASDSDEQTDADIVEGVVTGVFQRGTWVRVAGEELFCGIAKTFRPPEGFEHTSPLAVGDEVRVALPRREHVDGQVELDRNRMDGMILSRAPRRTVLSRPQPISSKRRDEYDDALPEKVIAANMDILLVVMATVKPKFRANLIDRFLIAAERGELSAVLVINKIDLSRPNAATLADLEQRGLTVVMTSAETGEGLDALREKLAGKESVLAGPSGVGKTSLINALIPHAEGQTRRVRAKDERGRHTTSQARIYDLPAPPGGCIVDTPGIRELDVPLEAAELGWYFPQIEALAPQCKFNDCTHTHEPRCAVRAAVESGELPELRYASYLRILESLQ